MSSYLENEINEEIAQDKIYNLYKKFKLPIALLILVVILFFSAYQIKIYITKLKYAENLVNYSLAIGKLNKTKETNNIIKELENIALNSYQPTSVLAINRLIEMKIYPKIKIINLLTEVIKKKDMPNEIVELLKIKKAIIMFNDISEEELLELINIKNKNIVYKNISYKILKDFYKSKNLKYKFEELNQNLNEK